ncbi:MULTISPECIES: contact-dependent growth inhibition system immunity protein [unclassified Pseudomonas]|uniref:contact-dependent growth inhibition system immunity protein n=1 Tax=unclassified Pseudomonas TaxID=196821 RepID=UPI001F58E5FA|nr:MULTISPECIES: contact-dependent growth inhibition system immunity protein [unclassified Pseudomonas]
MNKDFPELQQFLAGYFNQDWVDEHKNANEVIASFISEASEETIAKVKQELNTLILIDQTEQELQDFLFSNIGCYYYYPNEWRDGTSWLKHVYSVLSKV